jgi:hypothetical protein
VDRGALIEAAEIIAAGVGDDEEVVVQRLVQRGFEVGIAHRLLAFVPSAFARPLLERLGVTDFAAEMEVSTRSGETFPVRLRDQPEYVASLALARDHFRHGILAREVFEAIVYSTAEVDAVSKALNAGGKVEGGAVATILLWPDYAEHVIRPGWASRLWQWVARLLRPR